ncbi:MAG: flagellin [Phycisphaerales bacterium]
MSRINTNISSLTAQRVLGQNNFKLGTALERLSTGLQISRGKDDPAGLIASENLRSELAALDAAVGNGTRADQVINIAEGGLQEISNSLTELQGLLTQSANAAGLSDDEKEANQLQIDSILQTIDRLSGSTSFQGTKLLNGSFDYQVGSVSSNVTDFQVNGAKFETATQDVTAIVSQSAQKAGLFLGLGTAATDGTGTIDLATGSAFTIEVVGTLGSRELSFSSAQTLTQIAAAINAFTEVTGVEATVSGAGVKLTSSEYGSDEYVSVKVNGGTLTDHSSSASFGVYQLSATDFNATSGSATSFTNASNPVRDDGQDIGGTINGIIATGSGKALDQHRLPRRRVHPRRHHLPDHGHRLRLHHHRRWRRLPARLRRQRQRQGLHRYPGHRDPQARTLRPGLPRRPRLRQGLLRHQVRRQLHPGPEDRRPGHQAGLRHPRPPGRLPEERDRHHGPQPRRHG